MPATSNTGTFKDAIYRGLDAVAHVHGLVLAGTPTLRSMFVKMTRGAFDAAGFHLTTREEHHLATEVDALTGISNRTSFMTELADRVALTQSDDQVKTALVFVDLDGFKAVNDKLGHKAGDDVLKEVADRLRAHFRREGDIFSRGRSHSRTSDEAARLGGDEFVLMVDDSHAEDMDTQKIYKRVCNALSGIVRYDNKRTAYPVTASMGIIFFDQSTVRSQHLSPAEHAAYLLKDADTAMYKDKTFRKGAGCNDNLDAAQATPAPGASSVGG